MSDLLLKRIGLLAEIASQKNGKQVRLGKTAMQKLLYLLQEAYHVPLDYRFSLYTYGPYDSQVMNDLDYADAIGALAIHYDDKAGYNIEPGKQVDMIEPYRAEMMNEHGDTINRLTKDFGDLNARDLELRSTLFYIASEKDNVKTRHELAERLKSIKPKYTDHDIQFGIDDLLEKGHLPESFST